MPTCVEDLGLPGSQLGLLRWMLVAASAFMLGAIVLQHRTVWAMLATALALAFLLDRDVFRVLMKALGLTIVAGLLVLSASTNLRSRLFEDLTQSATSGGTFSWRVETWQRSIEQDEGVFDMLIGQPMGSGYTRLDIDQRTYTQAPPHNEFVNQYVRLGVLGMLLMLAIVLRPLRMLWLNQEDDLLFPGANAWLIACAAILTFGIPYCYTGELIGLVAIANGLTSDEFALEQERGTWEDTELDEPDEILGDLGLSPLDPAIPR